jgi:hypothetical protein
MRHIEESGGPPAGGTPGLEMPDRAAGGEGASRPLALWGGLECTVARIGDAFRDQSRETGHHGRAGDLAAVAALGIRTLRHPVLWETIAPESPDACDWRWHVASACPTTWSML